MTKNISRGDTEKLMSNSKYDRRIPTGLPRNSCQFQMWPYNNYCTICTEVRAVNKRQLNIANLTKNVDQKQNGTKFGWTSGKLNNSRFLKKQLPKEIIEQVTNWTKYNWTEELNKYCSIDHTSTSLSSLKECLEICENKIFLRLLRYFSNRT